MKALMPSTPAKKANSTASSGAGGVVNTGGATASAGGAGANAGMQTLPGMLPAGFHPELYGLDPESQYKDCADEAKCMHGLMAFQAAQGGSSAGQIPLFFPSAVLASPRPQYVLQRPQYML